ncbi:class I SAM-dependent methyltransferase [Allokutzneria sp. NRRL B-24872]|uniref:class I SAM-dependent methyltransferase n=1 Tax=Allokutzneria sp. NRRL B-24872 TaxID=1137961 RepID=UPI000A3A20C1|nr:class I SAM-dependent methyltransferase [Allokutzneria sp. NRRL B-24872]
MSLFEVLPLIVTVALVLNGFRLRGRVSWLPLLDDRGAPAAERHRFLTAEGVQLDQSTKDSASSWAREHGLTVLELVPRELSVGQAIDLAHSGVGKEFVADRFAHARGAGHAILIDEDVARREGLERSDGFARSELTELTVQLKRLACTSTDYAVAPDLEALPEDVEQRVHVLRAKYYGVRKHLVSPVVGYALLIAGLFASPWWGLGALAAFSLQPYLIFAGSPIRPADLHRHALLRLVLGPVRWGRTVAALSRNPVPVDTKFAEAREHYERDLADGTRRFFEPRRHTCPWCGAEELTEHVRGFDVMQNKPGQFVLDRCGGCGHVFQNPRLSLEGLEFYYRDCYDGYGSGLSEAAFDSNIAGYKARAEMLRPFTTPRTWLDVGSGHGHFCNQAKEAWPETEFHGLDMTDGIDEAVRRGWVEHGYRGMFPDLTEDLAGKYDVISMHHYLEHTREPFEELDAAAKVLDAGGFLLIELPNPESRYGRILRATWMPWFQPQHQHMIPWRNLERALADRGFSTVDVHLGEANQANDLVLSSLITFNHLGKDPRAPWSEGEPTLLRRARYVAVLTVGVPFIALAFAADKVIHLFLRRGKGGNTYRLLARKDG